MNHPTDTSEAEKPANVLVVVAHPDDAVLSMGGTLLRLAHSGASIAHLSLSRGDRDIDSDGAVRVAELKAIFDQCLAPHMEGGRLKLLFGDLPDGAIAATGAPVTELLELLDKEWGSQGFDLAFLHGGDDQHVDHVNAHRIGHRLARNADSVLYFDAWSSLRFVERMRVDVTHNWSQRLRMLSYLVAHPQRLAQRRVELKAELCGTYLGGKRATPTYAEGFDVERLDASVLSRCLDSGPI